MSIRIHPADQSRNRTGRRQRADQHGRGKRLTVWKRSSMSFHGTDGFTVFDERGRLVFRVDNYTRNTRSDVLLLMDGVGSALLTLRHQPQMGILGLQSQWNAYRGEDACRSYRSTNETTLTRRRVFSMRSKSYSSLPFLGGNDELADVFMHDGRYDRKTNADFRIHGSFRMRSCKITAVTGQTAATVARKKVNSTVSLGDDVFSLVVQPGFDPELIMAFLVVLDRISAKPFVPFLCS